MLPGEAFHPVCASQHDKHPVPARVAAGVVEQLIAQRPLDPGLGAAAPPDALRFMACSSRSSNQIM
jgi:hypothetical protein